mmetsp:Transcript_31060/g.49883  ORF Transcript_31060/g.49883 Transcript_31060/m.49883 type:complete len:150 (+) Transcript_31060:191-640(+)|eukprot:CAMPEP_0197027684 /NCGR_PEP_ID=MMETSP1384-20130603/7554_1 /TAXON_ID=29189 /ORGANISM="Ammonia sp." /LENGTH=149 /DNA_ID=CAMNT_0042456565 /DNA_START=70 /DNA_END=519 /DNA_ORIENTATION=-
MADTQPQTQTVSSIDDADANEQASQPIPAGDVETELEDSNTNTNANGAGAPTANKDEANSVSNSANTGAATKSESQLKEETDKYSSLKSDSNPLTIARQKAASEGRPLIVNFDERVVVHTVPYWDPCGETFNDADDDDGPRGPNCCAIL